MRAGRMPTSRAPMRLTAVARSALPATVRSNSRKNSALSTTADATISSTWPLTGKPPRQRERAADQRRGARALGPEEQQARARTAGSAAPATTISSTSTDASAIGCSATRATSGVIGTTSSTASAICTARRHASGRRWPRPAAHGSSGSTPQPSSARGMRAVLAAAHQAHDLDERRPAAASVAPARSSPACGRSRTRPGSAPRTRRRRRTARTPPA